jgi:L-rhamnose isomerase
MRNDKKRIEQAYEPARRRYADIGVDTELAMQRLAKIAVSIHCWQGDDVAGFEGAQLSGGGILATGAYPGRARNPGELRADMQKALGLIPGRHRASVHASYLETAGKKVDRNDIRPQHYTGWIDWAKDLNIALDFNHTFFSHPKAASGFTLASYDEGVRRFWIEHGKACRRVGEHMGKELGSPCVLNLWIPDGYKDIPVDRKKSREILKQSLDEVFSEKFNRYFLLDAVESKLFGIGSESCVIGSHEFYLGYCVKNNILVCLDAGHFHPTEVISDKISSILLYIDEMLLHVSRAVRWDSDHVVVLSDELRDIASEIVRGDYTDRVHIGLDFFDASINRVAAWVIGTRCMLKALLIALLEPTERLRHLEVDGDYTQRLALLEELKTMPYGAVWDRYCEKSGVPAGEAWIAEIKRYEKDVLSKRV